MTEQNQKQLGKTLWAIADQLRGAMDADDFRDYMLSFLFLRYLSDNYEAAAKKELGADYPAKIDSSGQNNRARKVRAIKVFFKRKVRQTPLLLSGAAFLVSSTVVSLGVPLAAIAVAALTTVFCTLLAVLPAMGLTAGKSHIDKWVVQPKSCRSAKTSAEAAGPTASCLSVTQPDGSVEKGRVVFATSTSLVLYDPVTGSVKRLGIEGSKVAVVDKLID